jgi:hypothetical protein
LASPDFVKGRAGEGRGNGCRSDPGAGGDDTRGYRGGKEDPSRIYLIYFRWNPLFLSSGASVEAFDFWQCLVLANRISWRLTLLRFFSDFSVECCPTKFAKLLTGVTLIGHR